MNYIGGNWEKGLGATYASINPRNETILWEGNYASKDQIKSAIDCASQAHFKWSSLSFKERLEIIKNFYNLSFQLPIVFINTHSISYNTNRKI